MIGLKFGQARVVQFAPGSAIDGRTLKTLILEQDTLIFEKQIQPARPVRIQAVRDDRNVISTPFAFFIQTTSVAVGVIQFEIYRDLAVGLLGNSDGIVARQRLPVDSKDALAGTGQALADERKRTQRTNHTTGNSQVRHSARNV
jgi:hypothetical protein